MRILITAGATREPIDAVRFLSNVSTGATGAALADALSERGHRVTLLHGTGAVLPRRVRDLEEFSTAADLSERLRRRLGEDAFHAVIMSAAVSDYRPSRAVRGKISSGTARLALTLVRNEKILPQLKRFSTGPLVVIGFKLTVGANGSERRRAVTAQFAAGGVDAVVHNDLTEIRKDTHAFRLFQDPGKVGKNAAGTMTLARALHEFLVGRDRWARLTRPPTKTGPAVPPYPRTRRRLT